MIYIIGYFLLAIAEILNILLTLFMWLVIARAIMSWIQHDSSSSLVIFVNNLTEPVIKLVRSRIPTVYGGIDFSPILIFLSILFLRTLIINSLEQAARSLI